MSRRKVGREPQRRPAQPSPPPGPRVPPFVFVGVLGAAVVAILVAAAAVTGVFDQAATAEGSPPAGRAALPAEVDLDEASALRDAGAFILDVREPGEWAEYHVPGSTLIPLAELPARIGEVPADRDVVVVCRSGNRSASGRDVLLGAGRQSVTSLAGGLAQWRAAGYPTVTGP